MPRLTTFLASVLILAAITPAIAQTFESRFAETPDGVWTGPAYWARPLQDWRLSGGHLECIGNGSDRTLHLLTHQLKSSSEAEVTVEIANISEVFRGIVGIRFGIQGKLEDYRYNAIWGNGITVGLRTTGHLVLGEQAAAVNWDGPVTLKLKLESAGGTEHRATIKALDDQDELLGSLSMTLASARVRGNIALLCHSTRQRNQLRDPVARFRKWQVSGKNLDGRPEQNWGPILWTQYTLDRGVMKLQTQLAPINGQGDNHAELQLQQPGWQTVARAQIDPLARTALFRMTDWDSSRDAAFRVRYRWNNDTYHYLGTIRRDPVDQADVSIAGFTGNKDYGFPNPTIVANVTRLDPDVLFFSGDQLYEGNEGFGITRSPVEVATLDYLRKWYLVGWSFGNLMRDRPTVHLPDDHDVYQGNIWGAGGRPTENINQGGYRMDGVWVNMVQRTQTGHLPDPVDPRPIEQQIGVYFTDMTYGRIGMAILEDRKFKVGPPMVPRDVSLEDAPLLGQRQLAFLEDWAGDWNGQDMKVTLSQTVFGQCHTYGGKRKPTQTDDKDANGWPPPGRNRAIRAIRKAHALMYAGDNHLPTVVHHGVDGWEDAGISFTVPSIAAGFPREWRPDRVGTSRQAPLPTSLARPSYDGEVPAYIGRFTSSWDHPLTFYAVGNPKVFTSAGGGSDAGDLQLLDDKRSGFGLVRFHKPSGRINIECYRILADLDDASAAQMPGWPVRFGIRDNYSRAPTGYLREVSADQVQRPVLIVTEEESDTLVYAIRLSVPTVQPWVFASGTYTVQLGDPDTGRWQTWKGLTPRKTRD